MKEYPDYELIYLIEDNDDEAYNILFKKHENLIRFKISTLTSTIKKFKLEHQEIYQEFLLAYVKAIKTYNADGNLSLKNYILKLIDQKFVDIIRRKIVKNNIETLSLDDEINDSGSILADIISDVRNNIDDKMIEIDAKQGKEYLSEFENTILNYLIDGYSLTEISYLTNKTVKQIHNTIYRIRTKHKQFNSL